MSVNVSFKNEETLQDSDEFENEEIVDRNEAIFNMRVFQQKTHLSDESAHDVVFNVSFAIAVPGTFNNIKTTDSISTRNSTTDIMGRNIYYFHLEFDLFSENLIKDPFKTDIVFFGHVAKIFPDRCESRLIPTWCDGEDTWICFTQRYKVAISDLYIREMSSYKMKVKIWDTKDKVQDKVRFFRLPPRSATRTKSKLKIQSWMKHTVHWMSRLYGESAGYKEDEDRLLPHQLSPTTPLTSKPSISLTRTSKSAKSIASTGSNSTSKEKEPTSLALYAFPRESISSQLDSYAQLEKLIESKADNKSKFNSSERKITKFPVNRFSISKNVDQIMQSDTKSTVNETEEYHKMGRINFDLSLTDLFIKDATIARSSNSVNSLEDVFCLVNIENSLLSDKQVKNLNPLTIKIKSLTNLPSRSQDYYLLNQIYKPIYCEYQFCNLKPYKSIKRFHNSTVYFDDVSVILLGEISDMQLKQQLINSFFKIKLYDRNKKETDKNSDLFSFDNIESRNIGDINMTSNQSTVTSNKVDKHFGEAKIDLSDIIKKKLKYLEVMIPIVPVSIISSDNIDYNKGNMSDKEYINYLECGTSLKISVHLNEIIDINLENSNEQNNLFNRIIIINRNIKFNFIRNDICQLILNHNCNDLNFHIENPNEMKSYLYSLLRDNLSGINELYTGCYIVDKEVEIVLIESSHESIKKFYECISEKLNKCTDRERSFIKLLYDETCSFIDSGNYNVLSMIPLTLTKNLSFYASQPLLYVRDILPKECVECICRLFQLIQINSMLNVIRNNLLPSYQMLKYLSEYLCNHVSRIPSKIEIHNKTYEKPLESHLNKRINVKTAPLSTSNNLNVSPRLSRSKTSVKYEYVRGKTPYSYSCQNNNAVQSAIAEIRQKMDPKRQYTYSQEYLFSGNVSPVDLDEIYAEDERKRQSEPQWIHKGRSSSVEDFNRNLTLPQSKKDKLKEKWRENQLHSAILKPTLPERDDRSHNFDILIRPINIIERDAKSAMPSYLTEKIDCRNQCLQEEFHFRDRMCVDNYRVGVHRVWTGTEQKERGIKSSNQLDKLHGMLKDTKVKVKGWTGRKYPNTNKIPALSVVNNYPMLNDCASNYGYTVGSYDFNRNLSVNYSPLIPAFGLNQFNLIHIPSQNSTIYKPNKHTIINNLMKSKHELMSPFRVTAEQIG